MTENRSEIEAVLSGDKRALHQFVERYSKLVSHIVFRMVQVEADREDLCQTVFLKLFDNLKSFRGESKISTWIGRVAYNQCLNFLQKKKVPLYEDIVGGDQSVDSVVGDHETPHQYTEKSDISEKLKAEIAQLPLQFRTILTLYHLDEMTYKEIANIMKMPKGTVKSYLFRARKLLKDRLTTKYKPGEL